VAHVQGGEVTGSIDEKVRHAVTKLSNLHLVSNDKAAERLVRMGEEPESVFVTGCPSIDLAHRIAQEDSSDFNVYDVPGGSGVGMAFDTSSGYGIVMQHPVTTECASAEDQVQATLNAVLNLGIKVFWFWPNVDAGSDMTSKVLRKSREICLNSGIYFLKNLSPENFLRLLKSSRCMIGNSSAGIRECSFLGVPTVNIGTRQNRRERAENVVDVAPEKSAVEAAIKAQWDVGQYPSSSLYGDGKAGVRMSEILATTTPKIDKYITY
jgi:UDP-hydrolysing UDP-N-acetyl-D-glucosamine 2-epimerase